MTNRAKILIAILMLIAAVGGWYYLYLTGNAPATPAAEPPAPSRAAPKSVTSTSARALEILPLPFLVTEAPKEAPAGPKPEKKQTTAGELAKVEAPPNPFVPLRLPKTKAPKPPVKKPAPVTKKPVAVTATTPPELLRVPTPKVVTPRSTAPVLPPSPRLGETLPLNLKPVARVAQAAKPKAKPAPKADTPKSTAKDKPSTLAAWAKAKGLKLAGVALGPVAVAIFKTADGFVSLAVGERFPKTDVVLKNVGPNYVILQQGGETLRVDQQKGGE